MLRILLSVEVVAWSWIVQLVRWIIGQLLVCWCWYLVFGGKLSVWEDWKGKVPIKGRARTIRWSPTHTWMRIRDWYRRIHLSCYFDWQTVMADLWTDRKWVCVYGHLRTAYEWANAKFCGTWGAYCIYLHKLHTSLSAAFSVKQLGLKSLPPVANSCSVPPIPSGASEAGILELPLSFSMKYRT